MKVAMYYNNNDVRLEEMPKPKINDDEILVKVKAAGICGSDVLEWYRIKKAPLVLGHEITGDIFEIGKNVKNFKIGQRVFVSHHVPCDKCYYCINGHHTACETLHKTNYYPGGFSEFIRVPKINVEKGVFVLPGDISYEVGTFIEPLGCVLRGQRLVNIKPNQTVLVIGSGISGLLHIRMAQIFGTTIIATDINDYRLNFAKKFGADFIINAKEDVPKKILELNGKKADIVIVCTGAEKGVQQALDSVDSGGKILFFAVPREKVPIDLTPLWRNEITLMTSYAAAPEDIVAAIEHLRNGNLQLEKMITHRLPLSETGKGFKLVAEAKESLKVIIMPDL